LLDLFSWRRDVRRFALSFASGTLERFIEIAVWAFVGSSQPWRFVIVSDPGVDGGDRQLRSCDADASETDTGDCRLDMRR